MTTTSLLMPSLSALSSVQSFDILGKGKRSIAVCNRPHRYRNSCHMGSHSVTCHPAEVTFPLVE